MEANAQTRRTDLPVQIWRERIAASSGNGVRDSSTARKSSTERDALSVEVKVSLHLPVTPTEIAEEAIAVADAGASIVHIHVHDPETGEPLQDIDLFRKVVTKTPAECNAIIQVTTGGALGMEIEDRIAVVPELEPEMASCNMGSFNFGLYQIADAIDEFEYDWERESLENTQDRIFPNSFSDLEYMLEIFQIITQYRNLNIITLIFI